MCAFAGCLLLIGLMLGGDVFLHREAFTIELALKKTSYSFGATLTKGILCNWLVCMAVWQGNAAQDITGKLLGIWFPISAFVTMGFEHCIANMFVIPLGIMLGAPLSVSDLLTKNLIPVTIGNVIGGAVFVSTAYGLAYGSWGELISSAAAQFWNRAARHCHLKNGSSSTSSSLSGSTAEISAYVDDLPQVKTPCVHMPAAAV
jgi:formate/nitrite transporter FocA (FNT family)